MAFQLLSEKQKALLQDALNPLNSAMNEDPVHILRPLPIDEDWVFVENPDQVPPPQTRREDLKNWEIITKADPRPDPRPVPRPLPQTRREDLEDLEDWVTIPNDVPRPDPRPDPRPLPQTRLEKVANVGEFFTSLLRALGEEGYQSLPSYYELTDEIARLRRQMPEVPRVVTAEKVMSMVTEGLESLKDLPESFKQTYELLRNEVYDLLDPNAVVA